LQPNKFQMKESTRQKKFARLVQKELAEIFQHDQKHLFNNAFLTVTIVRMSPDLAQARVYLSVFTQTDKNLLLEKITANSKQIKWLLADRIRKQVRIIPELFFFLDDTQEEAGRIDALLKSLNIQPEKEETEAKTEED
jgi:ribosome-binding factor A